MVELSEDTLERVRRLFAPEQCQEVIKLLETECGNNLPFLEKLDKDELERFRFAALKLSDGSLDKLRRAVELGKRDWRDLLVAADFANDLNAHRRWEIKSSS